MPTVPDVERTVVSSVLLYQGDSGTHTHSIRDRNRRTDAGFHAVSSRCLTTEAECIMHSITSADLDRSDLETMALPSVSRRVHGDVDDALDITQLTASFLSGQSASLIEFGENGINVPGRGAADLRFRFTTADNSLRTSLPTRETSRTAILRFTCKDSRTNRAYTSPACLVSRP
jgi:hypothetical protein